MSLWSFDCANCQFKTSARFASGIRGKSNDDNILSVSGRSSLDGIRLYIDATRPFCVSGGGGLGDWVHERLTNE